MAFDTEGALQDLFVHRQVPQTTSAWSKVAQHLLKPLSSLSLRRTSSAPPLPPTDLLHTALGFKPPQQPASTDDIDAAITALVHLRAFEQRALQYIIGGQGTRQGEKLVRAQLAKGCLWCFGSIFGVLQTSELEALGDDVQEDLLSAPDRLLRAFFRHWQGALRIVLSDDSVSESGDVLAAIRGNLESLGASLPHGSQGDIPEQVLERIADCKISGLVSTATALTLQQQQQPPRLISGAKSINSKVAEAAAPMQVQLGCYTADSLYALVHSLCAMLETVPDMHDVRMVVADESNPEAVVENLALASERPLRLRLDLGLLKLDLALSTAVFAVRHAPPAPPKASTSPGKRPRGSMSSSRSRSMSRKMAATASPAGSVHEESDPAPPIESPEVMAARLKRESHDAMVMYWESRAEESLAGVLHLALEVLGRGKESVLTRESLLDFLLEQTEYSAVTGTSRPLPNRSSTPDSELAKSDESVTSSDAAAKGSLSPLESMLRMTARYFEWRIGRWEALGLKDTIRRDTYARGRPGGVGDTGDLLGISLLGEFEQDELLQAGLEHEQLDSWLDTIAEQERQRATGKRPKSDQHKKACK